MFKYNDCTGHLTISSTYQEYHLAHTLQCGEVIVIVEYNMVDGNIVRFGALSSQILTCDGLPKGANQANMCIFCAIYQQLTALMYILHANIHKIRQRRLQFADHCPRNHQESVFQLLHLYKSLQICDSLIEPVKCARYLGIIVQNDFCMAYWNHKLPNVKILQPD